MIIFAHWDDGSFVAGDTVSRMTCYAYPTSANAQQAKKAPAAVAALMLVDQKRYGMTHEAEYDARNWARLDIANPRR